MRQAADRLWAKKRRSRVIRAAFGRRLSVREDSPQMPNSMIAGEAARYPQRRGTATMDLFRSRQTPHDDKDRGCKTNEA